MANTAAGTLITTALDNISRAAAGTTRSGATLEARAMIALNAVMMELSRRYDFRETKKRYSSATVASAKSYNFPTNWKVIVDIVLVNDAQSIMLKRHIPSYADKRNPYPENDSTNQPYWYIPWGNTFEVYPIPDAAYTMWMRTVQWPTTITSTADLIDYEPNKDDIIVTMMTSELFDFLQLYTDAREWEKKGRVKYIDAMRLELNQPDWSPKGEGFDANPLAVYGDYYNNPFVYYNP